MEPSFFEININIRTFVIIMYYIFSRRKNKKRIQKDLQEEADKAVQEYEKKEKAAKDKDKDERNEGCRRK